MTRMTSMLPFCLLILEQMIVALLDLELNDDPGIFAAVPLSTDLFPLGFYVFDPKTNFIL